MNIGLIDVDSKNFPNLCLMKLSAWHKKQGDSVEWYNPFTHYDLVYKSKVFANTPDYSYPINSDKVIKGGTGYAIHGAGGEHYQKDDDPSLPYEIEHIYPDYDLYNIKDTAYGFLTRGCPRGCSFCIVALVVLLLRLSSTILKPFSTSDDTFMASIARRTMYMRLIIF